MTSHVGPGRMSRPMRLGISVVGAGEILEGRCRGRGRSRLAIASGGGLGLLLARGRARKLTSAFFVEMIQSSPGTGKRKGRCPIAGGQPDSNLFPFAGLVRRGNAEACGSVEARRWMCRFLGLASAKSEAWSGWHAGGLGRRLVGREKSAFPQGYQ